MTLLDRVVRLLADLEIHHTLIGAAALAARGVARSTYDIDLLTMDSRALAPDVWQPLRDSGATVDVRRGDDDDPLAGVVRIEQPGERPIDIIVGKHRWQARAVERAERLPGTVPVVTARDLVLLKLYAGGTQDLWDIRELLEMPGGDRLITEVSEDLVELPRVMHVRWAQIRQEPG